MGAPPVKDAPTAVVAADGSMLAADELCPVGALRVREGDRPRTCLPAAPNVDLEAVEHNVGHRGVERDQPRAPWSPCLAGSRGLRGGHSITWERRILRGLREGHPELVLVSGGPRGPAFGGRRFHHRGTASSVDPKGCIVRFIKPREAISRQHRCPAPRTNPSDSAGATVPSAASRSTTTAITALPAQAEVQTCAAVGGDESSDCSAHECALTQYTTAQSHPGVCPAPGASRSPAEVSIKAVVPGEAEHDAEGLLLEARAPIPRTRQAPVDAAARVVVIVRPGPVKPVAEKVHKDGFDEGLWAPELLPYPLVHVRVLAQLVHRVHGAHHGS
mmetsp:Transcript_11475/g.39153  ORF Transcript_11475/g.39153 Transcript_11475/m.39153 type:complete len:331 (-) Transcript_11475:553-1545(-)